MAEHSKAAKAWIAFVKRYPPIERTAFGKQDAWSFCNGYAAAEAESVNADLLAACEAALELVESNIRRLDATYEGTKRFKGTRDVLRAAIAKGRGEGSD